LRERVRQSTLYAVREAARQINFGGVIKTLPLTFQTIVDNAVLRKRSERLRDRAGECASLIREARINSVRARGQRNSHACSKCTLDRRYGGELLSQQCVAELE